MEEGEEAALHGRVELIVVARRSFCFLSHLEGREGGTTLPSGLRGDARSLSATWTEVAMI